MRCYLDRNKILFQHRRIVSELLQLRRSLCINSQHRLFDKTDMAFHLLHSTEGTPRSRRDYNTYQDIMPNRHLVARTDPNNTVLKLLHQFYHDRGGRCRSIHSPSNMSWGPFRIRSIDHLASHCRIQTSSLRHLHVDVPISELSYQTGRYVWNNIGAERNIS